jgi:hypothetical protein
MKKGNKKEALPRDETLWVASHRDYDLIIEQNQEVVNTFHLLCSDLKGTMVSGLNADMAKHTTMVHTLNRWEEIIDN